MTANYDAYMKEKAMYVELLKKRSDIFTEEADACGLDLDEIVREKVKLNNEKYPVEKAFGSKEKYTELKDK